MARARQVVTKDELLEAVWPETMVSEGVLKTCIGQIRQVLGETGRTPQYGAGEAYLPLLEALGQLGRGPDGVRLFEILRQLAPS